MFGLGLASVLAVGFAVGWAMALGVLAGSLVSCANFIWLKQVVNALADRVTDTIAEAGSPEYSGRPTPGSGGIVARFLLRYILIGFVSYAILKGSPAVFYGFLGGLFLVVAAIVAEAGYELYVALRHGI